MLRSPLFAFIFLFPAIVHAGTWIVAKDGTGQFSELQPAIQAASSGDIILVREGSYASFDLDGKALTILGKGAPSTTTFGVSYRNITNGFPMLAGFQVKGTVSVSNCPAPVAILSLEMPPSFGASIALSVANGGPVWIQDVQRPSGFVGYGSPGSALSIINCAVSAVSNSKFAGDNNFLLFPYPGAPGQTAAFVNGGGPSYFANAPCLGGGGLSASNAHSSTKGGDGLVVQNIAALLAGDSSTSYAGGPGGNGYFWTGAPASPAGKGVKVTGTGLAQLAGVTANSTQGLVQSVPPVPTSALTGAPAVGKNFAVQFQGDPGEFVFLLFSDDVDYLNIPGVGGMPLFVSAGAVFSGFVPVGNFDASGKASLNLAVPADPAFAGLPVFFQGLVFGADSTGAATMELTNLSIALIGE